MCMAPVECGRLILVRTPARLRYEVCEAIGEGADGEVFQAIHRESQGRYAVKIHDPTRSPTRSRPEISAVRLFILR